VCFFCGLGFQAGKKPSWGQVGFCRLDSGEVGLCKHCFRSEIAELWGSCFTEDNFP
jgi:hypothetical protein